MSRRSGVFVALILLASAICITAGAAVGKVAFDSLLETSCGEDTLLTHSSSAPAAYTAEVWVRCCGATTGWNTKVYLSESSLTTSPNADRTAILEGRLSPYGHSSALDRARSANGRIPTS